MEEPKEEKEFLKREEVRTMEKDIARLREAEAKAEREKVAAITVEKKLKKEEKKAPEPKKPAFKTLIPRPRYKKPSLFRKIFIRGLIIVFLLLLLSFLYWFFEIRTGAGITPPEKPTEEISVQPPLIPEADTEIEEKIGQLFIIGFEGGKITPKLESLFKKYKPGGVLLLARNIENREQLKSLISGLQGLSLRETGLPLLVAVDQEGEPMARVGFLTEKTPQANIEDTEKAYQIGLKRGRELKELGINLNLAPVLDAMTPADFYYNRTFQKPVGLAGQLAKSLISGQKEAGILTALKHFPGYVGINFSPEGKLASAEKVPEISQFKKAMEANPEFVMTSNMAYREIDPFLPFTFSPEAVQLLKNNLGKEVLVVSDDLAQRSLTSRFSLKEIVQKPIEAGVDVLIFSGWQVPVEQGLEQFFAAVKEGEISKERLAEAVSRVVQLKKDSLK